MPVLFAEFFAPWCEKARWALDHHGVKCDYREHVPLLGDLALLVDGDEVLTSSLAIARYAERVGSGAPLIPKRGEREISTWNDRSEAVMVSGRAMLLARRRSLHRSRAGHEASMDAPHAGRDVRRYPRVARQDLPRSSVTRVPRVESPRGIPR